LADVAKACAADLQTHGKYGVTWLRYWVDEAEGKIFYLVDAPDTDTADTVHREAHGLVADEIYAVSEGPEHSRRQRALTLPSPAGPGECTTSASPRKKRTLRGKSSRATPHHAEHKPPGEKRPRVSGPAHGRGRKIMQRVNILAHKVLRTVMAVGLAAAVSLGTAGVASAARLGDSTCGGQANRYTVCLYITSADSEYPITHYVKVHVGIDVKMTQQDAQNIIDGGGQITARMWGSDSIFDDNLKGVTLSWVSAWEGGLSAEFNRYIWEGDLDEDPEGVDEVYAKVELYIPSSGVTRTFRSPEVETTFSGGPLGP
jgi:hypothetical protein